MYQQLKIHSPHQITPSELIALIERLSTLGLYCNDPLHTLSLTALNQAISNIHLLLRQLPSHLDEVRTRATPCSLFELRVALFALIDSDMLKDEEADQIAPFSRVIGVGELEHPLSTWLEHELNQYRHQSSSLQIRRVERGLAAIFHSAHGHEVFESLSEAERIKFSGPWVRPMMRIANRERFPKQALLALYRSTNPEERDALLQQFERCRRKVRVQPFPTYELLIPTLNLAELSLLFAYWEMYDELEGTAPYMNLFSEEVQQLFDNLLNSERQVS